jgi:hypothetical protein
MATAHAGILSKDVEFWLDNAKVENLQEFPDLGGAADQVDVTTLADGAYMYINGIKDYGSLEFTFLYDNSAATSNYRVLRAAEEDGAAHDCEVRFPDGTKFTFSGMISTTITGAGVNAALQFTATVNLQSDITVADPADAGNNG